MAITPAQCKQYLDDLPPSQQARFLAHFGHQLTVVARDAYEHLGPGVDDPRCLRDLNEIYHRIFPQIGALTNALTPPFANEDLMPWLLAEGKPSLSTRCLVAFERAVALSSRAQKVT